MSKDALVVDISDMHSGSNYALFLGREWHGTKGNSHIPTSLQVRIRRQWEEYGAAVRTARKGRTVKLVHNGDAIDGDHHQSGDVCTLNVLDQADIHCELMAEFQKMIGWQAGDELYYTRGTQSHVNELENYIGREMNAVMCGDFWVHDLLKLDVNGVRLWFVHHGPGRGQGANEGNSVRNWLKNIRYDAMHDQDQHPDVLFTGHTHDPIYNVYVYRDGMNFKLMHGIISPSWQAKTTYAWQKAPVQKNKIGGVYLPISKDGEIGLPRFSVMVT